MKLRRIIDARVFSQTYFKTPSGPRICDLDTPFTLARPRLIPDSEAGFDRRIRVYARGWAMVAPMAQRLVAGRDAGTQITHRQVIREDRSYIINSSDLMLIGDDVYVVRSIVNPTRDNPFLDVMTTHAGSMAEHDLTLVEGDDDPAVPPVEAVEHGNDATDYPLWM